MQAGANPAPVAATSSGSVQSYFYLFEGLGINSQVDDRYRGVCVNYLINPPLRLPTAHVYQPVLLMTLLRCGGKPLPSPDGYNKCEGILERLSCP